MDQIEQMAKMSGSYESLFSKRAIKYKSMGLNKKVLTENEFKKLILEEYTFLKRPVIIINDNIFVGNAKNTIDSVAKFL
jgi:arsenate reductase